MKLMNNHLVQVTEKYKIWVSTQENNNQRKIPLICVHGGPGSTHEVFNNFPNELKDKHIQIVYYDSIGSYHSDHPDFSRNKSFLSIDYFVEELEHVRCFLRADTIFLVGHSFGGLIAQMYYFKYPQHVKGLVIMSMLDNTSEYLNNLPTLLSNFFSKEEIKIVTNKQPTDQYRSLYFKFAQKYICHDSSFLLRQLKYGNSQLAALMNSQISEWDNRKNTPRIKAPTLITIGEQDTMPIDSIRRMNKEISNSNMAIIKNAGHFHCIDNPTEFFKVLRQFLSDNI